MNWFFDGIGTEIVILIVGLLFGINGKEIYLKIKNKQSQKAGNWANQFHTISPASTVGDVFGGDKYIMPNPGLGEFNIRNLSQYNTSEIEHEISKGNNDTLRELCFELIFNQKSDYLIKSCINRMDNNAEKYKLLVRLSERNFTDSELD